MIFDPNRYKLKLESEDSIVRVIVEDNITGERYPTTWTKEEWKVYLLLEEVCKDDLISRTVIARLTEVIDGYGDSRYSYGFDNGMENERDYQHNMNR